MIWPDAIHELTVQWSAFHQRFYTLDIPYLYHRDEHSTNLVRIRFAKAVTGPWSSPQLLYAIPPPHANGSQYSCYAPKVHPELTKPDKVPQGIGAGRAGPAESLEFVFTYICQAWLC